VHRDDPASDLGTAMTARCYRIIVNGLIGPTLASAFPGFSTDLVSRHHILLVPDDAVDRLLTVLGRLGEHDIEVEQITSRYR
jgi:hypothetical protein